MTITPDKSALEKARERLEDECQRFKECYRFDPEHADVRLVLDALAEEPRRKWNDALVCAENAVFEVARSRKNKRTNEFKLPLQEIKAIRALAVDLRPSAKDSQ